MNDLVNTSGDTIFDAIRQLDDQGNEYWYARDLMKLLGYNSTWQKFEDVIERAKTSIHGNNELVENHFNHVVNMVSIGYGAQRPKANYKLSRYACYIIAQNGDPKKPEIAKAQAYFTHKTRQKELDDKTAQRLKYRKEYTDTDKALSETMYQRDVSSQDIGIVNVNILTTTSAKKDNLRGVKKFTEKHIDSNKTVRKAWEERGVKLEELPPEKESIKAIEKKQKKQLKNKKSSSKD